MKDFVYIGCIGENLVGDVYSFYTALLSDQHLQNDSFKALCKNDRITAIISQEPAAQTLPGVSPGRSSAIMRRLNFIAVQNFKRFAPV